MALVAGRIAWIAMDGFDNGVKQPLLSPHRFCELGSAVDFAPHVGMRVG